MLIFIYGDDTFRVQEKVRVMKDAFKEKFDPTGMNTAEYSGKLVLGDVIQSVRSLPFLGKKRMIVIRDLIDVTEKADMKVWVEGLVDAPDSSIVVFWETAEPSKLEKKPLFKTLQEAAEVHHYVFPQLQGAELGRWVAKRVRDRGGSIDVAGQRALVERVGADLWQMDQEIGKLVAYAGEGQITPMMVNDLVHASFEGKIFGLIDAISQRRTNEAIKLLQKERWSGANDHYLLTMLGRQVRILLGARALLDSDPGAGKQRFADVMGLHPFVAGKALDQARRFSIESLRNVHDKLYTFDYQLKTGQIAADLAVDLTTIDLIT
ncbi:MAG: DNA polymerase III subunit delta [Parcubacteria group bacterium]|nr:DNA polymerase III subunit delta [Parcubacteria group bacterium]